MSSYRSKRRRINEGTERFVQSIQSALGNGKQEESEQSISNTLVLDNSINISLETSILGDKNITSFVENSNFIDIDIDIESQPQPVPRTLDFKESLKLWSLQHNITHSALSDLLKIVNSEFPDVKLPNCSKTFLRTPRIISVEDIAGGQYFYFGIENQIKSLYDSNNLIFSFESISLLFGCDGFPVTESSSTQMWPILFRIKEFTKIRPILVGLFCGETKPTSLREYLEKFIDEIYHLQQSEIQLTSEKKVKIVLYCIVCDTLARSFLKCIKGHSGYSSCERCDIEGFYDGHVYFQTEVGNLRTNESFRNKCDPDHHQSDSPLLRLDLDLVGQFVLDYMHLFCLGTMRRLLYLFISGPLSCRLSSRMMQMISDYLASIRKNFPREFSRRPRGLAEIKRYKATEFRQFLLYTGQCALRNVVPGKNLKHFLLFHTAAYILLSPNANNIKWNSIAKALLSKFVQEMAEIYGRKSIVYNVHAMNHIADDALKFGSLDSISAFAFESYLFSIKKLIRGNNLPLQQVVKRVMEWGQCQISKSAEHTVKISNNIVKMSKKTELKRYRILSYWVTCKMGDNCFILKNNDIVIVDKIFKLEDDVMIRCKKFDKITSVPDYPFDSSLLGIVNVSIKHCSTIIINVQSIVNKCVLIPCQLDSVDTFTCIPMLKIID